MNVYIVEIKKEYTCLLLNILTPFMFQGMKSLYDDAVKFHNKNLENNLLSEGVSKIFEKILKSIPELDKATIDAEINRIKENGNCEEWLDILIKAVFKSHIILLSNNSHKSELIYNKLMNKMTTSLFIHECYIECSQLIFNNSDLFLDAQKKNQKDIIELIRLSINNAIQKILPIKDIIEEYLSFLDNNVSILKKSIFSNEKTENKEKVEELESINFDDVDKDKINKKEEIHKKSEKKIKEENKNLGDFSDLNKLFVDVKHKERISKDSAMSNFFSKYMDV